MKVRIALEWDELCGLKLNQLYPLIDGIEDQFKNKEYGVSISSMGIVMSCLGREIKPRKRYKKDSKEFEFDIVLDYFLISGAAENETKKKNVCQQMIESAERTFSNYKFENFDKAAFLEDLKVIINSISW